VALPTLTPNKPFQNAGRRLPREIWALEGDNNSLEWGSAQWFHSRTFPRPPASHPAIWTTTRLLHPVCFLALSISNSRQVKRVFQTSEHNGELSPKPGMRLAAPARRLHRCIAIPLQDPKQTRRFLTGTVCRLLPTTRRRSRSSTPVASAASSSTSSATFSAPAGRTRPWPRSTTWRRALAANVSYD
jgi:hypothetical protein